MPERSSAEQLVLDAATAGDVVTFKKVIDTLPKGTQIENIEDDHGKTALFLAASNGKETFVNFVVTSLKFDPNKAGRAGSALQAASSSAHPTIVRLLLQAGADPNARPGFHGMSPLFLATATAALQSRAERTGDVLEKAVECVELLLQSSASPNTLAPGGFTPLHVAAEIGNDRIVDALLAAGASTALTTDQGQTAKDVAMSWGHEEIAEKLQQCAQGDEDIPKQATQVTAPPEHLPSTPSIPAPEDPDLDRSKELQSQGNQAFVNGNFEEALVSYRSALRHQTDNAQLWSNCAAAALKLHRYEEALRDARIARTVDPKLVKAWYREGKAAEALEHWADAAAAYFEAHLLDPVHSGGVDFGTLVKDSVEKGRRAHNATKEVKM
jgi:hypothetical protein